MGLLKKAIFSLIGASMPATPTDVVGQERFTDRARVAIALANREARRLNHEYIGSEHILLGIIEEGTGVGVAALKHLGVDFARIRSGIAQLIRAGPDIWTAGALPQTPTVKRLIQAAIDESRRFKDGHVGTEHLLLGILAEPKGMAFEVLHAIGIDLDQMRATVPLVRATPS